MVLFFALIALVVMSLAAVALIRSVDTSTMIAGNIAFKQSATTSGDSGLESAITTLTGNQAAMTAANSNVLMDPNNVFNVDSPASGYYSSANPNLNLTDPATWTNTQSFLVGTDASGNEIRYIIQRMCRIANQTPPSSFCMYSSATLDNGGHETPLPSNICTPPAPPAINGCPAAGQAPEYRITTRAAGPGNTSSYVQAFVY